MTENSEFYFIKVTVITFLNLLKNGWKKKLKKKN